MLVSVMASVVVMGSDESADETLYTDCAASETELHSTPVSRQRQPSVQLSVPEMVRRAGRRQSARRPTAA